VEVLKCVMMMMYIAVLCVLESVTSYCRPLDMLCR